ncbi:MAG: tetratricopeptide repeat protein, partial [Planctomycetota bacterium]
LQKHFENVSRKIGLRLIPSESLVDMWGNAFLNYDEDFQKLAIPLLRLNVQNFPGSPNAHVNIANAYLKMGQSVQAKVSFEKALRLDSMNEAARNGLESLLTESTQ